MKISHFGISILDKPTNRINKEWYLSAKPEGMSGWTEEHYVKQIAKADLNYDLNMAYFNSLDFAEFNSYLLKTCEKFKLSECFDLNVLDNKTGVYMMVLDDYKQVYIGMSENIKQRILSHWRGRKSLERLIFGDVCNSILSIDSFGALDTTRIFYIETRSTYKTEENIVKQFFSGYMLNRTAGGIGSSETSTEGKLMTDLAVVANRKTRNLIDFLDVDRLKNIVSEEGFKYYLHKYPELSKKQYKQGKIMGKLKWLENLKEFDELLIVDKSTNAVVTLRKNDGIFLIIGSNEHYIDTKEIHHVLIGGPKWFQKGVMGIYVNEKELFTTEHGRPALIRVSSSRSTKFILCCILNTLTHNGIKVEFYY